MDENKRAVLKEVGYQIREVCGLCEHGDFEVSRWGTCRVRTYDHLKHSDTQRQLSINTHGWCPAFEWDAAVHITLGKFTEFQEKSVPT